MPGNRPDETDRVFREHAALAVLRLLDGDVLRGAGNDQLLCGLLPSLGFRISRAAVRDILGLLERAGALVLADRERLVVVEISRHGHEVACGIVDQEGVARPGPECPY